LTNSAHPPVQGGGERYKLAEAAFEVAIRYPATVAAYSAEAAVQAAVWAARIWALGEGWACVGVGHDGHIPPNGKYQFRRLEHRFYRWPEELSRFLAETMTMAAQTDVYIIPTLRADRSAKKGSALPGRACWADVDGQWTPERAEKIAQLNTWRVASGSGGRHVYLPLVQPEPPEHLEAWNRRFGALLDADAKWAENALLRLPGTLNHKPRANGGASIPVTWTP
jgi:hypothetical protein